MKTVTLPIAPKRTGTDFKSLGESLSKIGRGFSLTTDDTRALGLALLKMREASRGRS